MVDFYRVVDNVSPRKEVTPMLPSVGGWQLRLQSLKLLDDERGQGLVEYAFILSLVSLAAFGLLILMGGELQNTLGNLVQLLQDPGP